MMSADPFCVALDLADGNVVEQLEVAMRDDLEAHALLATFVELVGDDDVARGTQDAALVWAFRAGAKYAATEICAQHIEQAGDARLTFHDKSRSRRPPDIGRVGDSDRG